MDVMTSTLQPINVTDVELTQLERQAVDSLINLSDGHPRQRLTAGQAGVVGRLPELFESVQREPFEALEQRAQRAFMDALGQVSAPVEDGRVFSLYASSVATMALGGVLAQDEHRVALVHPTFDNIYDILRHRVPVFPLRESACAEANLNEAQQGRPTCVFVTTPNNPTGWHLGPAEVERLAAACAARNMLLCFDTSFRGFDTRTQFDLYRILNDSGVEYAVIEDTGKLWPMSELKLGFLAVSPGMHAAVHRAVNDVLLTVSPLVLALVELLAQEGAGGGLAALRRLIAINRSTVATGIAGLDGVDLPETDSRVSVCRLRFRSASEASRAWSGLRDRGVHVLPGQRFHWARPEEGSAMLRLALARNTSVVAEAMGRLRAVVAGG
jgi:aspartate/methionine/tyrosine aminotransferase